ncbi:hypothetical protein IPJ70_01275 [Candidatus Campbellbacteria bacterium]|nr:MAG: hypothetical protein IPJ70_01275 [Candidatus Campbellbacteria bacterium]
MTLGEIAGLLAVVFGILGSWGLWKQNRLIWGGKSAKSVSGTWVITFLAMFTAFLIYGTKQSSVPMMFQGWLRVAFSLPVSIGFVKYGRVEREHIALGCIYLLGLATMVSGILAPTLFVVFSTLGILASFVQAWTIRKNRSRGAVAVELQMIYLAAVVAWLVYGFVRKDIPLMLVSTGFIGSYSSTVIMWFRYPQK